MENVQYLDLIKKLNKITELLEKIVDKVSEAQSIDNEIDCEVKVCVTCKYSDINTTEEPCMTCDQNCDKWEPIYLHERLALEDKMFCGEKND